MNNLLCQKIKRNLKYPVVNKSIITKFDTDGRIVYVPIYSGSGATSTALYYLIVKALAGNTVRYVNAEDLPTSLKCTEDNNGLEEMGKFLYYNLNRVDLIKKVTSQISIYSRRHKRYAYCWNEPEYYELESPLELNYITTTPNSADILLIDRLPEKYFFDFFKENERLVFSAKKIIVMFPTWNKP